MAADTGGAGAAEGPGSLGVLERYTLTTQQAGPQVVGLTVATIVVGDSAAVGWWGTDGEQVWDANYTPQYGIIAIDRPCAPIPVGGIAKLPDVSDSSGRNYMALAALAAAALVALSAGTWYAGRRWGR